MSGLSGSGSGGLLGMSGGGSSSGGGGFGIKKPFKQAKLDKIDRKFVNT